MPERQATPKQPLHVRRPNKQDRLVAGDGVQLSHTSSTSGTGCVLAWRGHASGASTAR